jgi:broad specificity polyphosphatase/5'/3'-nucleotidase SurE
MWERLSDLAVDIVETVLATGIPPTVDVLSVNMPEDADRTTDRVVTRLARTKYGPLFSGDNGTYAHSFDGILHTSGDLEGSDLQILDEGLVSITPIRYVDTASLNDATREMWEKGNR